MNQPWYPQQPGYAGAPGPRPPSPASLVMAGICGAIFGVGLLASGLDVRYIGFLSPTGTVVVLLRLLCAVMAMIGAGLLIDKRSAGRFMVVGSVATFVVVSVIDVALHAAPGAELLAFAAGIPAAVLCVVPPTSRYLRYARAGAPTPYPQQPWYPPQHPWQGYPQQGHPQAYPYQGPQPPRA